MTELKPCPFCGGQAEVEQHGTHRQSHVIACMDCGGRLETGEVNEFRNRAWNTRALPKEVTDILRTYYEVANQWGDPFEPREKYNEMVGRAMQKHEDAIKAAYPIITERQRNDGNI